MYQVPGTRGNKIAMLLFCYVLFTAPFAQAQCIASGPNSPASSTSASFAGSDYSFSNPLNCLISDNNRSMASPTIFLLSGQTEYLQATNFGFSIPTAATVCGIEVNIEKSATNLLLSFTSVTDNNVRIIKNGSRTGTNLAQNAQWSEDNDASTTYGNNNELWGTSWTPSDINSTNFGVAISASITGIAALLPAARIDNISITVYYLDPSVLPAHTIQFHVANGANNTALLSWKPTGIDETASFTVERSVNSTKWEMLNSPAQKNTTAASYTYTDAKPLPGKSFYRLKMVSASGDVRYSTMLAFEPTDAISIKCYPNPFTSFIQVTGVLAGERVAVTDIYGQCLYLSTPAKSNTINIDVSDLQPGMYVISTGKKRMKIQKK
ncbi:MAG TPA: T9SS type A sorting domain-containing protein [Niastella sp.]